MISPPISSWINTATKEFWANRIVGINLDTNIPWYGSMLDQDGKPHHVYGSSVYHGIYRVPPIAKTFSPYGNGGPSGTPVYSKYCTLHHRGWIYFPISGWDSSGGTIGMVLRAYNPATNVSVDVTQYDMAAVSGDISNAWAGGADVAIDPITNIGVVVGYVTVTTHTWHYFPGAGGGDVDETGYQTFRCMRTFYAGTRTSNPSYKAQVFANNYTYSTSAANNRTNQPLVSAYNNTGIWYEEGPTYGYHFTNITSLSSGTTGSDVVTGYTPLCPMGGPNFFMSSATSTTLRDATHTWALPYSGLNGSNSFAVISEDSTNWYVAHTFANPANYRYVKIYKLAKAGTTVTDMGQLWYHYGSAYGPMSYPYYFYVQKFENFMGADYNPPGVIPINLGALGEAALRLDKTGVE